MQEDRASANYSSRDQNPAWSQTYSSSPFYNARPSPEQSYDPQSSTNSTILVSVQPGAYYRTQFGPGLRTPPIGYPESSQRTHLDERYIYDQPAYQYVSPEPSLLPESQNVNAHAGPAGNVFCDPPPAGRRPLRGHPIHGVSAHDSEHLSQPQSRPPKLMEVDSYPSREQCNPGANHLSRNTYNPRPNSYIPQESHHVQRLSVTPQIYCSRMNFITDGFPLTSTPHLSSPPHAQQSQMDTDVHQPDRKSVV